MGHPRLIIGLGSGRCGTFGLSRLLRQHGVYATHEIWHLPWKRDVGDANAALKRLERRAEHHSVMADVGFYWLRYIPWLVDTYKEVRCICLKRNMEDTVASFMRKMAPRNYWTDRTSCHWEHGKWKKSNIEPSFPKYDAPKEEAIAQYWRDYYDQAMFYQWVTPESFRIYDMDFALNTEDGRRAILAFAEVEGSDAVSVPEPRMIEFIVQKGV